MLGRQYPRSVLRPSRRSLFLNWKPSRRTMLDRAGDGACAVLATGARRISMRSTWSMGMLSMVKPGHGLAVDQEAGVAAAHAPHADVAAGQAVLPR